MGEIPKIKIQIPSSHLGGMMGEIPKDKTVLTGRQAVPTGRQVPNSKVEYPGKWRVDKRSERGRDKILRGVLRKKNIVVQMCPFDYAQGWLCHKRR